MPKRPSPVHPPNLPYGTKVWFYLFNPLYSIALFTWEIVMKKFTFTVLALISAAFAAPALASDVMVASTMQRCTTNEECALVTNSCKDNCGFVPVNRANLTAIETLYQTRCGKAMSANPTCNMNPPISAACINARCTIDYAYANNAGAKDYQAGAYPVPEAPVPSKVPAGEYAGVNDRNGKFTAYDLPQNEVKQDSVGTITTKVYVPPSAPVSGGNYVPVTGMVPSAPAAPQTPPMPNPAFIPPTPAAAPTPPPAPVIPPQAVPSAQTHATPPVTTSGVPAMVPSRPNQLPPEAAPQAYVPDPTQPTIPAPGLPPAPSAPVATTTPAVPAVGAPGVPQAPAGSTPIPPSDLKPAPTFVPPPGTPVPVAPEDPGAPPPEGTTMIMPLPNGEAAIVGGDNTKAGATKSFNTSTTAKKKTTQGYN